MKRGLGSCFGVLAVAVVSMLLAPADAGAGSNPQPQPGHAGGGGGERPVDRLVLPNGLTVLLSVDHRTPLVGMQLRYSVGMRDDPETRPGLSALVARMMVRATTHIGEGDYDRYLDGAGAFDARFAVTLDWTAFSVSVPSDQVALPLWLWSDQMGFFANRVDEHLIAQQLAVIRNESAARRDTVPAGIVRELVAAELYSAHHPYHVLARSADPRLDGVSPGEVRAFVDAQFTPDRAILSLVGDFDRAQARALVERYFGTLRPGHGRRPPIAAVPSLAGETRLEVAARVETASLTIVWPTAAINTRGDPVLDVIASLLTGQRAGWLRWKLIDELKIASRITAYQHSEELASEFVIEVKATRGHGADELLPAIDGVLRQLQSAPLDDYGPRSAVNGFLFDKLLSMERMSSCAWLYAAMDYTGVRSNYLAAWLAQYLSIDSARLSAVAAHELPIGRRVVVTVTPASDAPVAGVLRGRSVISP
jgi:zinc protease